MFSWHANIFVRLLIPFLVGIGMNLLALFPDFHIPIWVILVFALLFLIQIVFLKKHIRYSTSWQYAIFPNLIFFSLGFFLTDYQKMSLEENHSLETFLNEKEVFIGEVVSPVKETEKTYKFFCEIMPYEDSLKTGKAKVLVLLKKDTLDSPKIRVGDILAIRGQLSSLKSTQNPGGFDYAKYLKDRGVYYQVFVEKEKVLRLGQRTSFDLVFAGLRVREKVLSVFEKYILDKNALAITSAILLGYDELLETKVKAVFAAAGAMHILCVSGLHVGIIYLMFSSLLKFLDRNKKTRILKALLLIVIIISYALITGLSPSVLRASVMFIVIIVGKTLQRKISIYNLLAFSAFLLLIFNPLMIREIGFQLSYLAVIGIVTIYPKIFPFYLSKYSLINKVWSLSLVSFAAILSTFPLSIYYFHQFPTYFFITNLLVIPAAIFIIYMGIALILMSYFTVIASFLGKGIVLFLNFLFFLLHELTSLPGAVIRNISFTPWMVILTSLLIIASLAFFLFHRYRALVYALLMFFGLMLLFTFADYSKLTQREVLIYSDNQLSMIDVIKGKEALFIGDSIVFQDENKQKYLFQPMELAYGIKTHKVYSFSTQSRGIVYHNFPYSVIGTKSLFQLSSKQKYGEDLALPLKVDVLWVHDLYGLSSLAILEKMNPQMIVVGAKTTGKVREYLNEYTKRNKIILYSIQKQGFLHFSY